MRDQQGGVGDDDVKLTVVNTDTGSAFKITSHTTQSTLTTGETELFIGVTIKGDTTPKIMKPLVW
ncbi:MAG: hypothetical protein ACWA5U_06280 [bacterium]